MIPLMIFGIIVMVAAGLIGYLIEIKRVGGIHFWRLGRLGGSVYLSRRAENPRKVPTDHQDDLFVERPRCYTHS